MYNVVLIDDEEFVIKSLSSIVEWNKYGFSLISTFTNPIRAMEYIKNNPVDAIILDIKMPLMNGIEFIKELQKFKPEVKTILLSAYSEFDYARQAIEYGAFLYLLKPISVSKMDDTLKKLYEALEQNHREQFSLDYVHNAESRKVILSYMQGEIDNENFLKNAAILQIDDNTVFMGVKITLLDLEYYLENIFSYGIERLYNAICQLLRSSEIHYILLSTNINEMHILCYENMDVEKFVGCAFEEYNVLISNVLDLLNLNIEIHYEFLKKHYALLKEQNADNEYAHLASDMLLKKMNYKNINEIVKSIVFLAKSDNSYLSFCHHFFEKIIIAYLNDSTTNEIKKDIVKMLSQFPESPEKLGEYIVQNSEFFTKSRQKEHSVNIIEFIQQYVEMHYDEDISLASLAELVGRNPSYLSRFFKNSTGEKYIDYINSVRIKKSIDMLLNENEKIYVIAEKVGFKDVNYFHRIFKEKVGLSPQQLRRSKKEE